MASSLISSRLCTVNLIVGLGWRIWDGLSAMLLLLLLLEWVVVGGKWEGKEGCRLV